MTEKNYIDIKGMQERLDEKDRQQAEQTRASLQAMTDCAKQDQEETNELFARAILSDREEAEKKKAVELEVEKARAIKEVEAKFESRSIKSEETKQLDAAYKNLLGNLEGLND